MQEEYGDGSHIDKYVEHKWIHFDLEQPYFRVMPLSDELVQSSEDLIDFGWFDAQEASLFRFNDDEYDFVFQAKDVHVAGGILVNMNPDRVIHKRFIYNFLNFLGDIGGFQLSLSKIAFFLLTICG